MDILKITELYKSFGDKEVLRGINLSVPEHSVYGFIGKNGSGKTTTMKAVLGLLTTDFGEIYVNDEKVFFGRSSTNRYVGYLPDVPEFYSFMTSMEYLRFSGEIAGLSRAECEARAEEMLSLVDLSGEKRRIKGFSRGMKQRLGIAAALLKRPKLLICDEPTSALDPIGRKEILELLLSIKNETTVLFSTHILSDIERICTDVAFLNNGKIEISGKLSDIKDKYRKNEEYEIETLNDFDAHKIQSVFPKIKLIQKNRLLFSEQSYPLHDIMNFLADNRIQIIKIEREEPSLESIFSEARKI